MEFRLDAPAELTLPHVASTADGTVEVWKYGTVILTDHIPARVPEATTVFLLRPDGAAAVTYRAFKESVRVLTELKLPAEFSWSSIFLAPLCDDLSLTLAREAAAYAYGAMHTIWLRSSDDEAVKAAMTATTRCSFQKYIFPECTDSRILMDLLFPTEWDYGFSVKEATIEQVSDTRIEGYAKCVSASHSTLSMVGKARK